MPLGVRLPLTATTSGFAPRFMEALGIKQLIPYRLELRDGPNLQQWLTDLSD
jgi:hypothetical protein